MKTHCIFAHRWLVVTFLCLGALYAGAADRLQGMYLMTKIWGSSIETSAYYFTPDGEVFENPKGGLDLKALKQATPDKAGKYSISGEKMKMEWGGKRSVTESKLERKDKGCFYFNGGLFCPVKPFKKGEKLEGTYSGGGSAGVGTGAVVSSASRITLKKDGSYSLGRVGAASVSSGRVDAGAASSSEESGTYEVDGYTLTLKSKSGSVTKVTAFPYDDERFYYEGRMMKR